MQDEIETILDSAEVSLFETLGDFTEWEVGDIYIQVESDSDIDHLLDAIRSLQKSLPDDLDKRRSDE